MIDTTTEHDRYKFPAYCANSVSVRYQRCSHIHNLPGISSKVRRRVVMVTTLMKANFCFTLNSPFSCLLFSEKHVFYITAALVFIVLGINLFLR